MSSQKQFKVGDRVKFLGVEAGIFGSTLTRKLIDQEGIVIRQRIDRQGCVVQFKDVDWKGCESLKGGFFCHLDELELITERETMFDDPE